MRSVLPARRDTAAWGAAGRLFSRPSPARHATGCAPTLPPAPLLLHLALLSPTTAVLQEGDEVLFYRTSPAHAKAKDKIEPGVTALCTVVKAVSAGWSGWQHLSSQGSRQAGGLGSDALVLARLV